MSFSPRRPEDEIRKLYFVFELSLRKMEEQLCLIPRENLKMQFKISVDILNETVLCRKNRSCLYGSKDCLCEVEDSFNNKIIFIKPVNKAMCDYRMSFGFSYVCNCPTRKEIFNIYRK